MTFNRYKAFGLHLGGSLCVALIAAALVFLIWYPGPLAAVSGVSAIFLIVLGVDVVLGPCITLVIFNPDKKPMREIRRDLAIVLCVQIAALSYGMYTVFGARPVFIAYSEGGSFEIAYANDFKPEKLEKGRAPEYRSLPLWGRRLVALDVPKDPKVRQEVLASMFEAGEPLSSQPVAYVPYERRQADVVKHLKPLDALKTFNKSRADELDALIRKYASRPVGWLPVQGKSGYFTAVIARENAQILEMNALAPL